MRKLTPPHAPLVQAAYRGGKQRPTAIELRASFTTSDRGAAFGIAHRLHQRNAPIESYHYILDSETTYSCVPLNQVAYHITADPKGSIGINLCAEPVSHVSFWDDLQHAPVLDRTVHLVAWLVSTHKIPVRYLEGDNFIKWSNRKTRRNGGIIIRVPGEWPAASFLENVKQACRELK